MPSDTQGPQMGPLTVAPKPEIIVPPCSPNTLTFSVSGVSDPAGIRRVDLYWRVVDGTRVGTWVAFTMSLASSQDGAATFSVNLAWNDLTLSLPMPYSYSSGRVDVEYYAQAVDGFGNVSTTPPGTPIQVYDQCVQ